MFSWDDKYLIGHEAIDSQHRGLFVILNELHEAMKSGCGGEAIAETLQALTAYAEEHFVAEEDVMLVAGYPELEAHRLQHRQLCERLAELKEAARCGEALATFEVLTFIGEWIVEHVGRTDAHLGKFLRRGQ